MTYTTQAIVLKKIPWREADTLYTFFTEERGKVQAVAKGARKIKSKMASHLEPFVLTNIMIAHSKTIDRVAGSSLRKDFLNIKASLPKIILASYVWEIVYQLLENEHSDVKIFRLLKRYLEVLDENFISARQMLQGKFLTKIFILQFFDSLGYTPELYNCVHCKKELQGDEDYFCAAHGGLICKNCYKEKNAIKLDLAALKYLRLMLISDLGEFERVCLPEDIKKDIETALEQFLKYRLERNLKSEKYMDDFEKYLEFA